jgi:hypothetical protein
MKRLTLLFVMFASVAFGQSDTTQLNTLINANFPNNTSNFITPTRLRTVAKELMRSSANLLEPNTFAERQTFEDAVIGEDSIKSDVGFYVWNGVAYEEIIGGGDTANWAISGGFISPVNFTNKLNVDTARFAGNLYPDGSGVNIGRAGAKFDTVFANVVVSVCECVQYAKLTITSAEVLALNSTPKAFGLTVPTGYYVQLVSAQMKATYNSVPYATNINLEVGFSGVKPIFLDDVLGFNSNRFANLDYESSGVISAASDVIVSVNNGNPTAGNSDITIYLTYILVEL